MTSRERTVEVIHQQWEDGQKRKEMLVIHYCQVEYCKLATYIKAFELETNAFHP